MSLKPSVDEYDDSDNEGMEIDDATLDAQEPAGIVEDETVLNADEKSKSKNEEHSLEVRRAIEEHLERNRLQKELDYLFDEHFTDDDEI